MRTWKIGMGVAALLSASLLGGCHCCCCCCNGQMMQQGQMKQGQAQGQMQKQQPASAGGADQPTLAPAPVDNGPPGSIPLGVNGPIGKRAMAASSEWNKPVDKMPVDPSSDQYIAAIGVGASLHPDFGTQYNGAPWGVPYIVVPGSQPKTNVKFEYADESEPGPYPIPDKPPVEGSPPGVVPTGDSNDQHLIIIDRDNAKLYELYQLRYVDGGWHAGAGAIYDLFGDTHRHAGWTSADAAGMPMFPGLVRYEEVAKGSIEHALRFTAQHTRRAYVAPANHWASRDTSPALPPMGVRLRLKASVDINAYPERLRPILVALKKYGMFLADNGGPLFLSGAPDPRWNDEEVNELKKLHGRDFEVVKVGRIVTP